MRRTTNIIKLKLLRRRIYGVSYILCVSVEYCRDCVIEIHNKIEILKREHYYFLVDYICVARKRFKAKHLKNNYWK